jgi:hypothetical protein
MYLVIPALAAASVVATSASPAHAEQGYTYACSLWAPAGVAEYRACVERNPGTMRHVVELKNMSPSAVTRTVTLQRYSWGTWNVCYSQMAISIPAWGYASRSCYSQRAGVDFRTGVYVEGYGSRFSPVVSGT